MNLLSNIFRGPFISILEIKRKKGANQQLMTMILFNIMQCVYDKDTFSFDDKMGDADIDVAPFLKASKMHLKGAPDGITLSKVQPTKLNCLTEESCIVWSGGRIVQNMILRLQNVECGEVELQLSA